MCTVTSLHSHLSFILIFCRRKQSNKPSAKVGTVLSSLSFFLFPLLKNFLKALLSSTRFAFQTAEKVLLMFILKFTSLWWFFFFQPLSKIRQGLETKRDMTVRTFDYLFRTMQRGKGTPKNPPTVSAQFQVCSCAWSILPVEVWVGTWQIEALNIN